MKLLAQFFVALVCISSASAQSVSAVLNSASYTTAIAPGTWVAVFGTQLAPGPMAAATAPFSTQLNGVPVTIGGLAAPLSYVSAGQINALVPFEIPLIPGNSATAVPLVVTTPSGPLPAFSLMLLRDAPAIYTKNQMGTGEALAFDTNFKAVTSIGTSAIVLYATGLGPTDPPAATGLLGESTEPLNRAQDVGSVTIGGRPATVLYVGLAPGLHGVYQLDVLPNPLAGNDLVISAGSMSSEAVTLPLPAGTNVTNVIGAIDGLYPATGAIAANYGGNSTTNGLTFSALLTAATFGVAFDIQPSAKPFKILAFAGDLYSEINLDPGKNIWTASYPIPTAAARAGDFSNSVFRVIDFLTDSLLPGNIIPLSRLDPIALQAQSLLAFPNAPTPLGPNGTYLASGTLPASGHFAIDGTSLPLLSKFGGYTNLSHTPGSHSTVFRLYVDNLMVATTVATFVVR